MKNSYLIREISEIVGCSKPTVTNALKKLGIEPSKQGKAYVLTQEQAETVLRSFGKSLKDASGNKASNDDLILIDTLREEIELLKKELETKNELLESQQNVIERLVDTNKALSASKAASDAKELLLTETVEEPKEETKKSFWQRLFG